MGRKADKDEYVDEAEIFKGSENKITLSQTYRKRFQCTYLLQDFPFDTQVNLCPGESINL